MRSENAPLLPLPVASAKADSQRHALLGLALVAASAVCFSVMSTFIKLETFAMSSMEAVFWRSLTAGALNYGVVLHSGQSVRLAPADRRVMLYRVTAGFCSIALEFYAISQMVLADASVIIFTSPVMTFFLGACVLRERIDPLSLACALTSFVGLVCVVLGQALVYVLVRKLRHLGVSVILHYFMLFSTIMSLIYIAVVEQRFVVPDSLALWSNVVGSGVFTFFGQMLLTKGFQLENAGVASVMRYLDVVCVFVWDALLIRERINHWSIIGAAIICACAVVIALQKANRAQ
ncbi:hypothetical protein PybrP1_002209 [[Pythium] brassicae (nom. inval.)]|nr:hypothetical protein PybrP1_002209 [[Pythium] brassicae (nom. inval.)]